MALESPLIVLEAPQSTRTSYLCGADVPGHWTYTVQQILLSLSSTWPKAEPLCSSSDYTLLGFFCNCKLEVTSIKVKCTIHSSTLPGRHWRINFSMWLLWFPFSSCTWACSFLVSWPSHFLLSPPWSHKETQVSKWSVLPILWAENGWGLDWSAWVRPWLPQTFFWVSLPTAKPQAHMEEVRLSPYPQGCLANSSTVGASASVQLIIARVWVYDAGTFRMTFCHMDSMHQISSGFLDTWSSSGLLHITSTMANSLRYWIPPSVVVRLLWEFARSSLKRYLSFTGVTTKDWGSLPAFQDLCQ